MSALLEIQGLVTAFKAEEGSLTAVDGLELSLGDGEVLGLVGESGCGKTVTALSVLGLLPPGGRVLAGRALFKGRDLLALSRAGLRQVRGAQIAMIFQEPMTSLNPVFTVGRQIAEGLRAHGDLSHHEAWQQAVAALERVGIPDAAGRARQYPHQFSGGMRQRVMIAMALALSPALLFADEPTTALDVTIQAQILSLLRRLQSESNASVLLITHNLAVVAQIAERVAVMYTGRIVEEAPVDEFFSHPLHPYSQGLLACLPYRTSPGRSLPTIGGVVPSLDQLPAGCTFSDRCPQVFGPCRGQEPALAEVAPGHKVRCYLHHKEARRPRELAA